MTGLNLKELQDKFDDLVAAVRRRIEDGGQDANAVLEVHPSQFKIAAITVPQSPPLKFAGYFREVLQTSTSIEKIADEFVAKWRDQKKADESI